MKKTLLISALIIIVLFTACEMQTVTEYVYRDNEQESKEPAETILMNKHSKIVTNAKDGYEEDDSSSAAKLITVGELQEHNYYDDANDWLFFTATSGNSYTLESWVYGSADTKLYLYNSSLSQLEYNDDKGDGTYGSQIVWTAPSSGTYYIKSNSYSNNTGNNRAYEISVTTETSSGNEDSYEEDDTYNQANLLSVGETQNHNFYDDADDWVYINAESGKSYTFESTVSGSADTYFYLYNSSQTQLASNDDGGSGYASKIEYTCTSNDTWYLKVYSYGGKTGADRDYTVKVTSSDSGGGDLNLPMANKTWTILVYLDADNNLSSYGTTDVQEMYGVGSSDEVNIVVLWDNSSSNHGYYYIQSGEATLVIDTGEVNMGAQATATDFIDWAVDNFPADHYMLDYWNHGGAVDRATGEVTPRGVAWDDTNGHDWLSETEQKAIIQFFYNKINRKIDIVGYDACLMATAEIAYMYDGYADYLVASEETEPGDGWDYDFLSQLVATPTMDAKTLSYHIYDYYLRSYNYNYDVTFSIADLSYVDELVAELDTFCTAAINTGNGSLYNGFTSGVADFSGYTKDLYGYMENVTNSSSVSSTIKGYAQNIMDRITNDFIVYEGHDSSWNNKAYGVSITMKSDTSTYSLLDICQDTSWDEFLTFCGF